VKRIIFILLVSAMVTVMLALSAGPAFAGGNVIVNDHSGQGGHNTNTDNSTGDRTTCLLGGGRNSTPTQVCGNDVNIP
jgi:hypothetical protein